MKRILLVEDTPDKANDIKSFLKSTYGDEIEVTESEAFKTAQQEILAHHHDYDMILLDMTMSTFDPKKEENGGTPEPVGGKQLLNYMYLNEITTKVLVVTMYKDFIGQNILSLDRELKEEYSDFYCGFVFFSFSNNLWMTDLKKKIDTLLCLKS